MIGDLHYQIPHWADVGARRLLFRGRHYECDRDPDSAAHLGRTRTSLGDLDNARHHGDLYSSSESEADAHDDRHPCRPSPSPPLGPACSTCVHGICTSGYLAIHQASSICHSACANLHLLRPRPRSVSPSPSSRPFPPSVYPRHTCTSRPPLNHSRAPSILSSSTLSWSFQQRLLSVRWRDQDSGFADQQHLPLPSASRYIPVSCGQAR